MDIRIDDLTGSEIADFLQDHLVDMRAVSPPESKHALDLDGLKQPDVTFWTVWQNSNLLGCGAIKELDQYHAELKSMRTDPADRKLGVASTLLRHIIQEAQKRGYRRLSLESGSMAFFLPAQRLYEKFGFTYCEPFGSYRLDSNSLFMTKVLFSE